MTILSISLLIDTLMFATVLTAAILQSTYLPHPLGQCGNALQWHPEHAPSMFLVLILPDRDDWSDGQIHETVKGKCHEFVTLWFIEMALM